MSHRMTLFQQEHSFTSRIQLLFLTAIDLIDVPIKVVGFSVSSFYRSLLISSIHVLSLTVVSWFFILDQLLGYQNLRKTNRDSKIHYSVLR